MRMSGVVSAAKWHRTSITAVIFSTKEMVPSPSVALDRSDQAAEFTLLCPKKRALTTIVLSCMYARGVTSSLASKIPRSIIRGLPASLATAELSCIGADVSARITVRTVMCTRVISYLARFCLINTVMRGNVLEHCLWHVDQTLSTRDTLTGTKVSSTLLKNFDPLISVRDAIEWPLWLCLKRM